MISLLSNWSLIILPPPLLPLRSLEQIHMRRSQRSWTWRISHCISSTSCRKTGWRICILQGRLGISRQFRHRKMGNCICKWIACSHRGSQSRSSAPGSPRVRSPLLEATLVPTAIAFLLIQQPKYWFESPSHLLSRVATGNALRVRI